MTDALQTAFDSVRREFESVRSAAAGKARTDLLAELRETLRRFRSYEGEDEWTVVLLDGAARFVSEVALFALRDQSLHLLGARGLDPAPDPVVNLSTTPAIAAAAASKDLVIALRTDREFGSSFPPSTTGGRVLVAPILNGSRIVAVLIAAQNSDSDAAALELLAGMGSVVLERGSKAAAAIQIAPAVLEPKASESAAPARKLPEWADLHGDERNLHLRAQRFARVKVAELQLADPDAARAGLQQNNVYLFLKAGIDAARESYRSQFMLNRRMVDYLHLELVRVAADGDEMKLGEEYPGSF